MSKTKFAAAKEMIDARHYKEARAVLRTIDHPTAREWERKLDAIAPLPTVRKSPYRRYAIMAGVALVLLIVIVLMRSNTQRDYESASTAIAQRELFVIATARASALAPIVSPTAANSPLPPTWTPTYTPASTNTPNVTNTPTCNATDWWEDKLPKVREFLDIAETAASTSRASLSPIVLELGKILREVDQDPTTYRRCFALAAIYLRNAMDSALDGYNGFLAQNDIDSNAGFSVANLFFTMLDEELSHTGVLSKEYRLKRTIDIWGGDSSPPGTATAVAGDYEAIVGQLPE